MGVPPRDQSPNIRSDVAPAQAHCRPAPVDYLSTKPEGESRRISPDATVPVLAPCG